MSGWVCIRRFWKLSVLLVKRVKKVWGCIPLSLLVKLGKDKTSKWGTWPVATPLGRGQERKEQRGMWETSSSFWKIFAHVLIFWKQMSFLVFFSPFISSSWPYPGPLLGFPVQDIDVTVQSLTVHPDTSHTMVSACVSRCLQKVQWNCKLLWTQ